MTTHSATVRWQRNGEEFLDRKYSRVHSWNFDGGAQVLASAAPDIVLPPCSDPALIDPEEAFLAALASCHMLFFLDFAAKQGYRVESYADQASGVLGKNSEGKRAITQVTLRPETVFSGNPVPDKTALQSLHHLAHEHCFIANSITTGIEIEPALSQRVRTT